MMEYPRPPMPTQTQPYPGIEQRMTPRPDFGEASYKGSGRLEGKVALMTGGDSGIGRAVALAFAREGADVAISYLNEDEDAREIERLVKEAGRRALLLPGDICERAHCEELVRRTVETFGRIDVLVNNAAFQQVRQSLEEIPDEEWTRTFDTQAPPPKPPLLRQRLLPLTRIRPMQQVQRQQRQHEHQHEQHEGVVEGLRVGLQFRHRRGGMHIRPPLQGH
jgi:NAD(P)-dependent dehydrogenase (short-subunit alcohol dehydrogenase family)